MKEQFRVFAADNQAVLYTAWQDSVKLAYAMVIFMGKRRIIIMGRDLRKDVNIRGILDSVGGDQRSQEKEIKRYNFLGSGAGGGGITPFLWGKRV